MEKSIKIGNKHAVADFWVVSSVLQHVNAFDDENIRTVDDCEFIRNDIVSKMRIDGNFKLGNAVFDLTQKLHEALYVIRDGKAFLIHDPAFFKLGVRVQKAVGSN